MRLDQLMHVVGAAANVVGETEFVVVSSQAILGSHPNAPEALLTSMEADIYPLASPERADEIDGALGDGSQFHRTFGYYAHAVGPETAKAPKGWEQRLVRLDVAPRPGSRTMSAALTAGLVDPDELRAGIETMPLDEGRRDHVRAVVEGVVARAAVD